MMRTLTGGLAILVLCLAGCHAEYGDHGHSHASASLSEEDLAAIEATTEEFERAVEAKDWAALSMTYTEDAILMPPSTPAVRGRTAIQEFYEAFPPLEGLNLENVEVLGLGDMAYVRGSYEMSITLPGVNPIPDRGHYIELRKKQADGSWLIYQDMFNSDMAPHE